MKQMYVYFYLLFELIYKHIMNLKEKVQELFAKYNISLSVSEEVVEVKQMTEGILEDGSSIYTDSDAWAVGVRVMIKDAEGNDAPLVDGEYKLADGSSIVVTEGVIAEIKPMEEEPKVEVEVEAETTEVVEQSTEMNAEFEAILNVVANLEKEIATLKAEKENLSAQVTKLSAQPAIESVKAEFKKAPKQVEAPTKSFKKMTYEERFAYNLSKHK
jgi:cell division protein FtsB